jgi:dienelactone hydrolase
MLGQTLRIAAMPIGGEFGSAFFLILAVLAGAVNADPVSAQKDSADGGAVLPPSGLILERRVRGDQDSKTEAGRGLHDPIKALFVGGELADLRPRAGQALATDDAFQWTLAEPDEKGAFARRGQYLYLPIEAKTESVMILDAQGHGSAYFNGEPRVGDVYGKGYARLPVLVRKGLNGLLLRMSRKSIRVRLDTPPAPAFLNGGDMTLPDLIVGRPTDAWAAAVVVNATRKTVEGLSIVASGPSLTETVTPAPPIPPLCIRKVGLRLRGPAPREEGKLEGILELRGGDGEALHNVPLSLRAVDAGKSHKRTFISEIDGSVQYFALRPATLSLPDDPPPAIVLSCHGAAVQAQRQSAAYSPKSWLHLVAPTNRRPYGFDWEDFGRADAMEVLEIAKKTLPHDPARIYLTGHSMGGHGAWHLAVTHPDKFAATGPSAAWISRSSYSRRQGDEPPPSPLETILRRGEKSGDTLALASNLKRLAVYILHGAEDDNVPVSQARRMAEALGEFHHDWVFHEEPDKRHWWSNDYKDGGNASVDWPFMFDLFARHALPPPRSVRDVDFATCNPGVSSRSHWLGIEGQVRCHDVSRARVHVWPNQGAFRGTTENVAVLRLDASPLRSEEPIAVELDGQTLEGIPYPVEAGALWLRRDNDEWRPIDKPPLSHKGSHRYGPIKDELRRRFFIVYATQGDDEENAAAFDKARFEAETFWYRGNASVELMPDVEFDAGLEPDRTVVLVGSADTNAAWPALLGDSPVQARRGGIELGDRRFEGDDLAAVFIRPRSHSDTASVIAVSSSGPAGMRAACQWSFFTPFERYPDCLIARAPNDSSSRPQPLAAGYFGLDWSIENGEFAFAEHP